MDAHKVSDTTETRGELVIRTRVWSNGTRITSYYRPGAVPAPDTPRSVASQVGGMTASQMERARRDMSEADSEFWEARWDQQWS